ncbi:MAG: ABC transporter ATP-binding protein [Thermoproteota archaeon]|nr:MAG: ABC transporter ATP-binding protein [Candidatus Korarchaeota archaeon]RLG51492.1 MAG: ABC transporter ATP-binding protein [Candidatus Korarchaeota archaeon]
MIKLREVYFSYNKEPVVKGVSLSLGNECIALAGPNGAGKTTILKLMAGIYRPKKGEVFIEGKNIWKLPEKEAITLRRKVVYVHENPIVLRGSVLNNVIFGLELRGVSKEEARKKALKLMRKLGIDELAEKDAKNLSAGQAQLLALARALIVEPSYMLLDEPLANLDWKRRKSVLELLKELRETGRSIAIATHDAFLVSLVCSKAYIIENGSVVSETLPPAIFQ